MGDFMGLGFGNSVLGSSGLLHLGCIYSLATGLELRLCCNLSHRTDPIPTTSQEHTSTCTWISVRPKGAVVVLSYLFGPFSKLGPFGVLVIRVPYYFGDPQMVP